MRSRCPHPSMPGLRMMRWFTWLAILLSAWLPRLGEAMRDSQIKELKTETEHLFYHGFDNYMKHAFPEDELRPLSCSPLTRKQKAGDSSFTDVLGNYSLTLVDSLSTLAILSSLEENADDYEKRAWKDFQRGVRDIVSLYGDGSDGPRGHGTRAKGFNIDSKVQVFETVIRGVGGLLSTHLFAVGDLPIRGYKPPKDEAAYARAWHKPAQTDEHARGILWDDGFVYDGQLLRLAVDLAYRVLPAFYTPTGLPYPRVNLRHGVPFYVNSPFNSKLRRQLSKAQKERKAAAETAETCTAGAGSLVLEFGALSRLTGDGRFEEMAKRAFWAVWSRRTDIDLVAGGIHAESGKWLSPFTGIGAGIDSFFEYSFKSHVLLSRGHQPPADPTSPFAAYDTYFTPLVDEQRSPASFLAVYNKAVSAIKHHLYRGSSYQYPHYIQGDVLTGATRAFWMDSLSAYFPGLLALSGDVEAGAEAHLLNAAIWTRFSGFPERWNVATGDAEYGMAFWGGRPEFAESNYYLYRATEDPWYLYVGEMVLRDMKRRCWTECGWAGLLDVRTGEQGDRMESFVLGETAKYLYLLFTPDHPLNHFDAPFVFSTEAHPLVIPRDVEVPVADDNEVPCDECSLPSKKNTRYVTEEDVSMLPDTCPAPKILPLGMSSIPSRPDYFHAASLVHLDLMYTAPEWEAPPAVKRARKQINTSHSDSPQSPSNYTFYPWTLPPQKVLPDATCATMALRPTLDLSFPPLTGTLFSGASMERVKDGILAKSLSGLRLGMIQDVPIFTDLVEGTPHAYRIQVINNVPLGRDERVYISRKATALLNPNDANFAQIADLDVFDLVIDLDPDWVRPSAHPFINLVNRNLAKPKQSGFGLENLQEGLDQGSMKMAFSSFVNHVASLLRDEVGLDEDAAHDSVVRIAVPAMTAVGKGAAGPLTVEDATMRPLYASTAGKVQAVDPLSWSSIYLTDQLCDHRLPPSVPKEHQIIVAKRGGCSFSQKLRNIPAFPPSSTSLQLLIIVSNPHDEMEAPSPHDFASEEFDDPTAFVPPQKLGSEAALIRPLLDEPQTVADGIPRQHPINVVLIGGGDSAYEYFRHAVGVGIKRRYEVQSQGVPISNLFLV